MPFIGRYYSDMWVRKNVLMQNEEEIAEMMDEMETETPPELPPMIDGQAETPPPVANKPKIEKPGPNIPGTGSTY